MNEPDQSEPRQGFTTTDEQRRRNTITLLVILGLVATLIATAIIVPNMGAS